MHYKFCPECGSKLTEIPAGDDGMVPYCDHCGKRWFDSFHSCVIVLVYNEYDEIALSKQWYLPEKYLSITSGFMVPGENAEEAARREVREELGLDLENLSYAGTYWLEPVDQLLHGFIGFSHKRELELSEEISFAEWVPALDAERMMFHDPPGGGLYEVYHQFLKMRGLENRSDQHEGRNTKIT